MGREVLLSNGMTGRAIAYSNQSVQFTDGSGGRSSTRMHDEPDVAACFASSNGGFSILQTQNFRKERVLYILSNSIPM